MVSLVSNAAFVVSMCLFVAVQSVIPDIVVRLRIGREVDVAGFDCGGITGTSPRVMFTLIET